MFRPAAASLVVALACTTQLSPRAARIVWAKAPSDVAGCEYLGTVSGSSLQSGDLNRDIGLSNSRNEALEDAAAKGATHVHWLEDQVGMEIRVTAEAYACSARTVPDEPEDTESQPRVARGSAGRASVARKSDDLDEEPRAITPPPATPAIGEKAPVVESLGFGSCFFVSTDGIAVTNLHVIEGASEIVVVDASGTKHVATVLRSLPDVDLAAIDVAVLDKVPALPVDFSPKSVTLGEPVFTIGFPYPSALGFDPKFADGAISGLNGLEAPWLLQVTVPVQPGNSGGPVVDDRGAVIGVIVSKLRLDMALAETGAVPENVNFAIKATELQRLLRGFNLNRAISRKRSRTSAIQRTQAAACQVLTVKRVRPVGTLP